MTFIILGAVEWMGNTVVVESSQTRILTSGRLLSLAKQCVDVEELTHGADVDGSHFICTLVVMVASWKQEVSDVEAVLFASASDHLGNWADIVIARLCFKSRSQSLIDATPSIYVRCRVSA